jgi:alcohol dehydrogenase (cytochrome c)
MGLAGGCAGQDTPNTRDASAAAPQVADWVTYNGPLAGDRFSPLKQITAANVSQLQQKCVFDAPEAVNFQSGIVAVKGVLYFTLFNHTYAVDATTCQQKWTHTRPEPDTFLMVNRGVGYTNGRLFRGTGDAHVLALDAADGKQLWDVSIGDPKKGESVPMAPIAWNGLVFVGNAGGDNFGVTGRIYARCHERSRRVAVQHCARLGSCTGHLAKGVTEESAERRRHVDQLCPRRGERHPVRADRQSRS